MGYRGQRQTDDYVADHNKELFIFAAAPHLCQIGNLSIGFYLSSPEDGFGLLGGKDGK